MKIMILTMWPWVLYAYNTGANNNSDDDANSWLHMAEFVQAKSTKNN